MTTTLNPSDKSAGITLSGGNLVAVNTNNSLSGVRAVDKQIHGKFYWEVTCNVFTNDVDAVSVAGYAVPLGTQLNSAPAGTGIIGVMRYNNGGIYYDSSGKGNLGGLTSGCTICTALDLDHQLVWFKEIGSNGFWNNNASYDPAASTGGLDVTAIVTVDAAPFLNLTNSGENMTANFGGSAFIGTVPSGYTPGWPAAGGGFTTWSATDKTNTTLSNGNLTATSTGGGYVRAADKQLLGAGKYYFELTCGAFGVSGNTLLGICPSALASPSYSNQTVSYFCAGYVYLNNGYQGTFGPGFGAGITVSVALDLVAKKIWFRSAPNGFWNGVSTANPATGVGGIPLTNIGPAYAAAPLLTIANTTDQMTANFGGATFVGAVPSGFTGGWASSGVTPATNLIVTESAIEEWVVGTGVAAIVTVVAAEEWVLNPALYGGGGQTRAMVMA